MQFDLAEAYRVIEPAELGRRLRDARILAGCTQTELAGGEVTAAYVSRIESGQRKPEFHLLGRMAERASTSLEALLAEPADSRLQELQVALDHAELNLAAGNPEAALAGADRILRDLEAELDAPALRRSARRVRALALEAMGRMSEAIIALEDLTADPQPDVDWLKSLIALSRCYRECGEFDRAISTGERAEATIDELGLAGLTEAIQLTVTVAGAYSLRGDIDYAMRLCLRARDDAERHGSALGRASAYWNASALESQRGEHQVALDLARKALAYFEVGEDLRNLARLRTQIAITQLRLDPPDALGAIETLDRSQREMDWSSVSTIDRADEAVTRARAHFLLGHHGEASEALNEADRLLPEDARVMRASTMALRAQLAMADADPDLARRMTTGAVEILTGIGADREAAKLWFELGAILEESGDTTGALDAFRRAAASTGLSGRRAASSAKASPA